MKFEDLLDWDKAFEWFLKAGCLVFVLMIVALSAGTVAGILWLINHFVNI